MKQSSNSCNIAIYNEVEDIERKNDSYKEYLRLLMGTNVLFLKKDGSGRIIIGVSGINCMRGNIKANCFFFFSAPYPTNKLFDEFYNHLKIKCEELGLIIDNDDENKYDFKKLLATINDEKNVNLPDMAPIMDNLELIKSLSIVPSYYIPKEHVLDIIEYIIKSDQFNSVAYSINAKKLTSPTPDIFFYYIVGNKIIPDRETEEAIEKLKRKEEQEKQEKQRKEEQEKQEKQRKEEQEKQEKQRKEKEQEEEQRKEPDHVSKKLRVLIERMDDKIEKLYKETISKHHKKSFKNDDLTKTFESFNNWLLVELDKIECNECIHFKLLKEGILYDFKQHYKKDIEKEIEDSLSMDESNKKEKRLNYCSEVKEIIRENFKTQYQKELTNEDAPAESSNKLASWLLKYGLPLLLVGLVGVYKFADLREFSIPVTYLLLMAIIIIVALIGYHYKKNPKPYTDLLSEAVAFICQLFGAFWRGFSRLGEFIGRHKKASLSVVIVVLLIVALFYVAFWRHSQTRFSIEMDFVLISAGNFEMGSLHEYPNENPHHHVQIQTFNISKYEVTRKQWYEIMKTPPLVEGEKNKPIVNVSWSTVQEFIKKLNEQEGTKYRLPTEAEWEYAARAGNTTKYFFSDNKTELSTFAVCNESSIQNVGTRQPNPWGLFDMYGNVNEWVQDNYHTNYTGAPVNGSAWEDPKLDGRVIRGGGSNSSPENCRSAYRYEINQSYIDPGIGFRLARD